MTQSRDAEIIDFNSSRAAREQESKIVRWTLEQFQNIKNARVATERQWYLNLAFFFGKQYVSLLRASQGNVTSTRLYTPPAPYYRSRPVINRVRKIVRTELAQLTNSKPNASIIPASAEDRDMYAAMAGEQIWSNLYTEKKLKSIIRKAIWWTLITGTGYIKSYWDFQKEDICFIHETPFHVFVPDFKEEEIENQPFIIHAQARSPEYVQMHYGDRNINPSIPKSQDLIDDSFLNLIGTQNQKAQQSILTYEVWVKPGCHPMFPEGAYYMVIGDKVAYNQQGLPYRHGKYPFAKIDHISSGKYYATSIIEDLIPLQKEFNRTRGQIIEAKNRMAKPQLTAPRGSVNAGQITSEPGLVIFYTPGFDPPQPLPLSPLPSYVLQELDRILIDMSDLSGQHEVTQGQVPSGVTAATAISYLQERDESILSPTFDSMEEAVEKIAQLSLNYVKDYWVDKRVIKIVGSDGSFDALAFKGSDLGDNTDIKIEAGSSLPTSKAAKQAFIMDLMKMGFIDPQEGLEVMEMGGINKIQERIQVDQRQAQRENLKMSRVDMAMLKKFNMQNQMLMESNPVQFEGAAPPLIVPVNEWDNHRAHIVYHDNYRKSQSFEALPEETKALFAEHVNQHKAALFEETMAMDPKASTPPVDSESEESSKPGPEPMPEMEGELL